MPSSGEPLGVLGQQQFGDITLGPRVGADDGAAHRRRFNSGRVLRLGLITAPAWRTYSASGQRRCGVQQSDQVIGELKPVGMTEPPPIEMRSLPSVARATSQPLLTHRPIGVRDERRRRTPR